MKDKLNKPYKKQKCYYCNRLVIILYFKNDLNIKKNKKGSIKVKCKKCKKEYEIWIKLF